MRKRYKKSFLKTAAAVASLFILTLGVLGLNVQAGVSVKSGAEEGFAIKREKSILNFADKPVAFVAAQNWAWMEDKPWLQQRARDLFWSDARPFAINTDGDLRTCEDVVLRALDVLPASHVNNLRAINLTGEKMERRGFGGYGSIDLQCANMESEELVGVLIHEMGHIADTDYLAGGGLAASAFTDFGAIIPMDDASVDFYSISWADPVRRKPGANKFDFVSGYAMTDPFEDFAESYTMYVLHGQQFKRMAEKNYALTSKYNFMKNIVFDGREFDNDSQRLNASVRIYDATRVKFSLDKFLGT